MNRVGRTSGTLAAAGLVVLALLVAPAISVTAVAAPVTPAGTASQQWAYGAEKWVNVSVDLPNATYTETAFFGWQVIFTATNTSNTSQMWEVNRTVAADFFAQYCQPNCSAPTSFGNLSVVGKEQDAGFANLTDAASVYSNGSAIAAVGLSNAAFENAASLNESMRFGISSGPVTGNTSGAFEVSGAAHGAVAFTPALGLVPLNLSAVTDGWNSTSAFAASGAWNLAFTASRTPFNGTPSTYSASSNGSIATSGTVSVRGGEFGHEMLHDGDDAPAIGLTWSGPFDVVDGVILIPHDFDLFGDGSHSWGNDQLGGENFATSQLDVQLDGAHHLELVAAATDYSSQDDSFAPGAAPTPMANPVGPTSSPTVVQAQPEPVPQAQHSAACLAGGCPSGASPGASPMSGSLIALVVVGLAVVSLVGLAFALRGRRGGRGPSPPAGAYGAPGAPPSS